MTARPATRPLPLPRFRARDGSHIVWLNPPVPISPRGTLRVVGYDQLLHRELPDWLRDAIEASR